MPNELVVDENNVNFNTHGMFYKEFPSDIRQIRFYTVFIVQRAPEEFKEVNLLEQQLSEIIKNAVKHGNKCDINKKVKVWYEFNKEKKKARVIVEDEGPGFAEIEKWNDFNRKRNECFSTHNFEEMDKFVTYRSKTSDESDGGNALFAALEYWNGGMVYSAKRNKVVVVKLYP